VTVFPLPLVITVAPSRRLRIGLALLHLVALAALWLADLPTAWQTAGSVLLALSLAAHGRSHEALALRGTRNGRLEIRRDDHWLPATQFSAKLLLPFLVLLHIGLPVPSSPRYLIVLPDSLPREDFRRLRVWIRWLGRQRETAGDAASIPDSRPA
jgi:hypothetical protein